MAVTELTPDHLKPLLAPLHERRFVVALSGGLDSVVLLELMQRLRSEGVIARLSALHVNHQLSPNALDWEQHCRALCERWQVPLETVPVTLDARGANLEEQAREARYEAMAQHCGANDCFLLAHHQQDQAETLLYRLVRGSGARGLGSIPRRRQLGAGELLRPLLDHSRSQLLDYGKSRDLRWVEDESNRSLRFDRNYLRHRVLPAFRQRWPDIDSRLARQAQRMAGDAELLDQLAALDLAASQVSSPDAWLSGYPMLSWQPLREQSPSRQRNLLRFWLRQLGVAVPGEALCEQLLALANSRVDANPCVQWQGWEINRYRGVLVVHKRFAPPGESGTFFLREGDLALVNNGQLRVRQASLQKHRLCTDLGPLRIGYRCDGFEPERIKLAGRRGSKSYKKLMQEQGVPPWLRDRWPLLICGTELVAVPSIGVLEGFSAPSEEEGFELVWQVPKWGGSD
ncbi:tRNA lysidine(34) synthetase TilS [Aestuariirhabdus sp. LZHN29]|uniref:tRNA lysidine(34) synthetase TilS n=1 Tax=Aestuariirhabdus sp. LZHN29 TaxID=3417462 RepID=UPI003CECD6E3